MGDGRKRVGGPGAGSARRITERAAEEAGFWEYDEHDGHAEGVQGTSRESGGVLNFEKREV